MGKTPVTEKRRATLAMLVQSHGLKNVLSALFDIAVEAARNTSGAEAWALHRAAVRLEKIAYDLKAD